VAQKTSENGGRGRPLIYQCRCQESPWRTRGHAKKKDPSRGEGEKDLKKPGDRKRKGKERDRAGTLRLEEGKALDDLERLTTIFERIKKNTLRRGRTTPGKEKTKWERRSKNVVIGHKETQKVGNYTGWEKKPSKNQNSKKNRGGGVVSKRESRRGGEEGKRLPICEN